jgi:LysR family transcriptional regulator of gallate degradation
MSAIDPYSLNLRHLLTLPVIGRAGGVTAASAEVHLSQPALTQGVAKIEAALGARLFEREPQGVSPTEAGALLLGRVTRAAAHLSEGGRALESGQGPGLELRLTMSQVRALISIAEHGSFAVAARESGLAEPSVHRSARELEETAGRPLFLRMGRTIQLTDAASRFARRARLAMAELRAGLDEVEGLGAGGAGRVVIGALSLPRAALIPRAIARFARMFPTGQVRVIDGPYAELLADLQAGDIDLIVGGERSPTPRDTVQEHLFDERLIVVGRREHPLAARAAPTIADLAAFPWVIARTNTPLRERWEAMFTEAGLAPPAARAECSSTMAIRGLLLEDDWLSLLSPDQVEVERRAGLIVQIGPTASEPSRRIAMTMRRDLRPTPAQAAMAALLRDLSPQGNE